MAISSVNFNINNRVRRASSSGEEDSDGDNTMNLASAEISAPSSDNICSKNEECCSRRPPQPIVLDIEDLIVHNNRSSTKTTGNLSIGNGNGMCSSDFNCAGPSQDCQNMIQNYQENSQTGLEPLEVDEDVDEYQTMQHTVLLILLLCAMFVVSCRN